ncbi:MAG: hypothetical protein D6682_06765 [Zetaproteobacteria bacterium]|nr:MAG: hypothetical protein D6682_06765 [Zetaproteobacteria bacterium]
MIFAILNGRLPEWLHARHANLWRGRIHGERVQVRWFPHKAMLELTSLSRAARVRLLLSPQ